MSGCAAVMRRVASMPLMPAMLMSMRTSSGSSGVDLLDGLLAGLGLAHHLEPGVTPTTVRAATRNGRLVVDDQDRARSATPILGIGHSVAQPVQHAASGDRGAAHGSPGAGC